jgi:hypothetical protein
MSGRLVAQRNPVKMIFGFNTDIKAENTVYHVQTEVREHERRLESQVFVSGRCIGKRSAPLPPEAVEEEIQELAREQHRWIVDAVREGFVDDVLNQEVSESLAVQFLGSHRIAEKAVKLSFRVLSGGFVAASAHVEAQWKTDSSAGERDHGRVRSSGDALRTNGRQSGAGNKGAVGRPRDSAAFSCEIRKNVMPWAGTIKP